MMGGWCLDYLFVCLTRVFKLGKSCCIMKLIVNERLGIFLC